MMLVMALIALLVYEYLGLAILRRAWVNLDRIWAGYRLHHLMMHPAPMARHRYENVRKRMISMRGGPVTTCAPDS